MKAEELYERSLALCRRSDGTYYPKAANTLSGYSALLRANGQTASAAKMEALLAKLRQKGP